MTIPALTDITRLGNAVGYLRNIVPADTAITFPLVASDTTAGATTSTAVFKWELWNVLTGELTDSATASTGGHVIAAGGSWSTTGLEPGAYHWIAHRETPVEYWGTVMGDSAFIVYAADTGLPDPEWDADATGPAGRDDGALLARCGLPLVRLTMKLHDPVNTPIASSHSSNEGTIALWDAIGYTGPRVLTFADYVIDDAAALTAMLNTTRYASVTHVGFTNEPNSNLTPEGGYITEPFVPTQASGYAAVKAATNPRRVLLAASVQMGPNAVEFGLIPALNAGLAAYYDDLDMHDYPGSQGEFASHQETADQPGYYGDLDAALAAHDAAHGTSIASRPRFITEGGTYMASEYDAGKPNHQAYSLIGQIRNVARHGVAQDHYAWFYGRNHGFSGFRSWLTTSSFTDYGAGIIPNVYPAALLTLTRAVQLRDVAGGLRAWLSKLDFGADTPIIFGNLYGGTDGTKVLDMQSIGPRRVPVTVQLSAALPETIPATVLAVDSVGNETTLTVTGQQVVTTVDRFGGYLHLPSGCMATIVSPDAFLDGADLGISTNGTLGLTSIRSAIEGPYLSRLLYDLPNLNRVGTPFRRAEYWGTGIAGTGEEQTVTVHLPAAAAPQTLRVQCLTSWHTQTVVLVADVLNDDGTVIGSIDEVSQLKCHDRPTVAFGGYYITYWDGAHVFDVDLSGPATETLTLRATQTTRGGSPTADTSTGYGRTPLYYGSSFGVPIERTLSFDPTDEPVLGAGFSAPGRLVLQRLEVRTASVPGGNGGRYYLTSK